MTRECPICKNNIIYSNNASLKRAIKNNSKCKICAGESQKGKIVSDETKLKMKLNHKDVSGINNPMYGKESTLKNKKWDEFRSKESIIKSKELLKNGPFSNKTHSEESKNKISLKSKGENNGFYGKTHSDETKNIIREKTLKMFKDGKIKTSNTSIEKKVKSILEKLNIEYIQQEIFGFWSYDFYLPKYNLFIECDGDYWHGNPNIYKPNELNKIQLKNISNGNLKDNFVIKKNKNILRLWESEIKDENVVINKIMEKLDKTFINND